MCTNKFFCMPCTKKASGKPKNLPEAPKSFHNGFFFGLATADVSNAGVVICYDFETKCCDVFVEVLVTVQEKDGD